jgi:hypothetical protein
MSQEQPDPIAEEQGRASQLRLLVDTVSAVIRQGRLSREEAERLVASTRARALELVPGKEATFDIVLAPRFARLLAEFTLPARGKVIPFPRHR